MFCGNSIVCDGNQIHFWDHSFFHQLSLSDVPCYNHYCSEKKYGTWIQQNLANSNLYFNFFSFIYCVYHHSIYEFSFSFFSIQSFMFDIWFFVSWLLIPFLLFIYFYLFKAAITSVGFVSDNPNRAILFPTFLSYLVPFFVQIGFFIYETLKHKSYCDECKSCVFSLYASIIDEILILTLMIILITWRKEFAQSVSNHQQEKIFYFMYPFYFLFAICYIPLFVSAFLNQDNYHLINLIFILLISLNFNFMTYFWVIRPIREAFQISNCKFQIWHSIEILMSNQCSMIFQVKNIWMFCVNEVKYFKIRLKSIKNWRKIH